MIYLGSGRDGGRVELPESILTLVIAIMAKRGAGKTYTAGVLEEEFAKAGLPFVTVDPVGVHHGIRSSADGKGPGYPIPVFGAGTDADIQIGRDSGADVARAICEENISAIVDIHELSKTAWRIFVRDFFQTLYAINRQFGPRMILLEEATEFVPQTRRPEMNESFEAVERTIRLGRNNLLGVTLISQRAAQVAKDAFYGLDILLALRTVGTLDVKALTDMLADQLEADQMEELSRFKTTISGLPDGTAWLWWPKAHRFEQVVIRERETYHAAATPILGLSDRPVQATPDLGRLRERFEAKEEPKAQAQGPAAAAELENGQLLGVVRARAETLQKELEDAKRLVREWESRAQHLSDEMADLREAGEADRQLAEAARVFIGHAGGEVIRTPWLAGAPIPTPAPERELNEAELAAIAERVRDLVGKPSIKPSPPAEAIREEYRQRAETFRASTVGRHLDGFMEKLQAMGRTERDVFKYLVGEEAYRSRNQIALILFGDNGGGTYKRVQAALDNLLAANLVVRGGSGRSEFKADLNKALKVALASASPTEAEIEEAANAALMEMLVLN